MSRTIVRCSAAINGTCKEMECTHFLEHEPALVDMDMYDMKCTVVGLCPVTGLVVGCELTSEN